MTPMGSGTGPDPSTVCPGQAETPIRPARQSLALSSGRPGLSAIPFVSQSCNSRMGRALLNQPDQWATNIRHQVRTSDKGYQNLARELVK